MFVQCRVSVADTAQIVRRAAEIGFCCPVANRLTQEKILAPFEGVGKPSRYPDSAIILFTIS